MKNIIIFIVVLIILGVGVYYFAFNKSYTNNTTDTNVNTTNTAIESETIVNIKDFAFNPSTLNIKVGTKITWINKDSSQHKIVSASNEVGPSSSVLNQNDTYSYTFEKAGTFEYKCSFHPSMTGSIVVTE